MRLKTRECAGHNNNLVIWDASHPKERKKVLGDVRENTLGSPGGSAPPKGQQKGTEECLTLEEVPGLEAPGGLATRCCSRSRRGGTGGRAA